jgi:hypothetical protein
MSNGLKFQTLIIPAGVMVQNVFNPGVAKVTDAGAFLYIKSATTPFLMQFDANAEFQCEGGFKFTEPYQTCTFYNPTLNPITVQFYTGAIGVQYVGTNQVKVASTYAFGNFGLTAAGVYQPAGLGVPPQNIQWSGSAPFLAQNAKYTIYGVNNGHQRKGIVFNFNSGYGSGALLIQDANGCSLFTIVQTASVIYLESDSTFNLFALNNNISLYIGEIYYAN